MTRRLDVTQRIVEADLCTGCGACAAVAPSQVNMTTSGDGFLRPVAGRLRRKSSAQIMKICPGRGQDGSVTASQDHPLWGGYEAVLRGWATDDRVRFAGASGGALSAVLIKLLETGQVDGMIQVQADPDNPIANRTTVSRSRSDILRSAASRYAPSAPLLEVPKLLEIGGRYAFVGKPCDVAALRAWEKLDVRISERFPIMLSFFCAGVPSEAGARETVRRLGVAEDRLASFRYRGNGWPGRTVVTEIGGQSRSMSYQESWGQVLSRYVQPRCRICADGAGLMADVAFGDAWQTDADGYPLFDEKDGVSLIVARSTKGVDILQNAKDSGALQTAPLDIADVAAMQPGQVRRRRELLGRLAGRVLTGTPIPRYRGLGIWVCARSIPVFKTIRAALGMARRCLQRRQ